MELHVLLLDVIPTPAHVHADTLEATVKHTQALAQVAHVRMELLVLLQDATRTHARAKQATQETTVKYSTLVPIINVSMEQHRRY